MRVYRISTFYRIDWRNYFLWMEKSFELFMGNLSDKYRCFFPWSDVQGPAVKQDGFNI